MKKLVHHGGFWLMAPLFLAISATMVQAGFEEKHGKVLEWGWGTPPPTSVKDNIGSMQQISFDGLGLDLRKNPPHAGDTSDYFSWRAWDSPAQNPAGYSDSINALNTTPYGRLTDRFLRFNVTPGTPDLDWHDDLGAVMANAAMAAKAAKDSGAKGILFDPEHYEGHPFAYSQLWKRFDYSFSEYQQQVRQRGREFMNALRSEYPSIDVLLAYGYAIADQQAALAPPDEEYGLLPSFLDGMLDAAGSGNVIYDGWEQSYAYTSGAQFENAYQTMRGQSALSSADPLKFADHYRASFGIWVDVRHVWDQQNFANNYFTPTEFKHSLQEAVKRTDGYVWVYSELARWWDGAVPQPYIDAVAQVRRKGRIERFGGTVKDAAAWEERTEGTLTGSVSQDDSLQLDAVSSIAAGECDYTSRTLTVGIGEVLNIEVRNDTAPGGAGTQQQNAVFGIALADDSGGTSSSVLDDSRALFVRWSNSADSILAGVNDSGGMNQLTPIVAADHPVDAKYLYQIERVSVTRARFSVLDINGGTQIGTPVTLTFAGVPDELYISLFAQSADATFDNVWVAALLGDFNRDGSVTATDIDLLHTAAQSGGASFPYDINGDGEVNHHDVVHQVQTILATRFGDCDLDGDVDLADLGSLAGNYGSLSDMGWAMGDFDGDGDVDLSDLGTLASNYGAGSVQALADFHALSSVPEPSAATMLALLGLAQKRWN